MRASVDACFRAGADVERWPEWLPHYRWVRFQRKDAFGTGLIEMAARRGFGPLPWPVWWVSEMRLDEAKPSVIYRHVQGITTGMDVEWTFEPRPDGSTLVRIVHEWSEGPRWPLPAPLRRAIGSAVIGPVFIRHIASRTLAGIRRHVEAGTIEGGA
ncbi:MAG: Polyketide cyclase/dehydrase [Gemmatimonadetes bacterium]|nr:Polyketide cyclase/dehydrase [Gemmatimonadota bacterium]